MTPHNIRFFSDVVFLFKANGRVWHEAWRLLCFVVNVILFSLTVYVFCDTMISDKGIAEIWF